MENIMRVQITSIIRSDNLAVILNIESENLLENFVFLRREFEDCFKYIYNIIFLRGYEIYLLYSVFSCHMFYLNELFFNF